MQYIFPSTSIYLAQSNIPKAGRGVFAKVLIQKKEVIEMCPVIVLPQSDYPHLQQTLLRNYYFMWSKKKDTVAIGLGFSSLYNHSYDHANATYQKFFEEKFLTFIALQDIKKDEEILVNYNFGNPNDKTPLWITDIPQTG